MYSTIQNESIDHKPTSGYKSTKLLVSCIFKAHYSCISSCRLISCVAGSAARLSLFRLFTSSLSMPHTAEFQKPDQNSNCTLIS
jgi:hypothetical protein